MSDIFLRYATEDLEKAKPIIELLSNQGWSVWWDRGSIPPGVEFDGIIEQAIKSAPVAPDLIGKDFHAEVANQKWSSDITYV